MSFGGSPSTSTSEIVHSPEQKKLINASLPAALQFAQSGGVKLPDIQQVPGFNENQIAGQNLAIGAATGDLTNLASGVGGASSYFLDPNNLSPDANPYLNATIGAAVRPLQQQFQETVLPGIRGGAISAGQLGGSRQGVAEGIAAGRFGDAIGDVTSGIAGQNFQAGQDRMLSAINSSPTTAAALLGPAGTLSTIGGQQYGLEAAQNEEAYNRAIQKQLAPYLAAKDVIGLASGLGSGTSTTTTPGSPGVIGGALGGAATGASIGSIIPGVGTVAGAGIGGVFGALAGIV